MVIAHAHGIVSQGAGLCLERPLRLKIGIDDEDGERHGGRLQAQHRHLLPVP